MKRISVALCTYNGSKYLQDQLTSIVRQDTKIDEIVICDDGSTDETLSIIEQFRKEWTAIDWNIFVNTPKLGVMANFEKSIGECSGDIIFLSDQDDKWMPDKVAKHLAFYEDNPDYLACFSNAALINDKGELLSSDLWRSYSFDPASVSGDHAIPLYEYMLLCNNIVTGATLSFKKEALEYILPFRKFNYGLHDYYISLVLSSFDKIGLVPEQLIQYRIHQTQQVGVPGAEDQRSVDEFVKNMCSRNFPSSGLSRYLASFWRAIRIDMEIKRGFPGAIVHPELWSDFNKLKKKILPTVSFPGKLKLLFSWWIRRHYFVTAKQLMGQKGHWRNKGA